jgi:micrococcal nuclease
MVAKMKISLKSVVTFSAIAVISFAALAEPTVLTGTVTKVRDGDTIEVGKIPIRLQGVSAPEMKEPLGPQSKKFMVDLVRAKRVRCDLNGEKSHDRFVGICYLQGKDIGAAVIKAGLALDCPRFSGGRYKAIEVAAARGKITLPGYCKK